MKMSAILFVFQLDLPPKIHPIKGQNHKMKTLMHSEQKYHCHCRWIIIQQIPAKFIFYQHRAQATNAHSLHHIHIAIERNIRCILRKRLIFNLLSRQQRSRNTLRITDNCTVCKREQHRIFLHFFAPKI